MSLSNVMHALINFTCFDIWSNCKSWDSNLSYDNWNCKRRDSNRINWIKLSSTPHFLWTKILWLQVSREWPDPWVIIVGRSGLLSQAFGLSSNLGVIEGFTWIPPLTRTGLDLDRKTDEDSRCGYKKNYMFLVILIVHCGSNEASYSICHWFWYYLLSLCLNEFQRLWIWPMMRSYYMG